MKMDEYRQHNVMAALLANTIEELPLDEMWLAIERADALGPVLDPTLYRAKSHDYQIDKERIRILRRAQSDLRSLRSKFTTTAT